jgi:hypothetical protein
MRQLLVTLAILGALALSIAGVAVAASPGTNGQPGQSCQSEPSNPGGAATQKSPGSPFNSNGVSGGVYANGVGSTPNGAVNNAKAVSQYDVACFEVSQPGHP